MGGGEELSCQKGGIIVVAPKGVSQKLNLLSVRVHMTANVSRPLPPPSPPPGVYFRVAFGKNNNSSSDSTVLLS